MCVYHRKENLLITESPLWRVYVILTEILCRIGPCIILVTLNLLMIRGFRASVQRRNNLKNGEYKEKQRKGKSNDNYRHANRLGKSYYISHHYPAISGASVSIEPDWLY